MKTKYRTVKVELDGVLHTVCIIVNNDPGAVSITCSRKPTWETHIVEEFPVEIEASQSGLNSCTFKYSPHSPLLDKLRAQSS